MLPKLIKKNVVLVTIFVEFVVLLLVINTVEAQQPPSLYSCINWECEGKKDRHNFKTFEVYN